MKRTLTTLLTTCVLLAQPHGGAVTCEAEFGSHDCKNGKVTFIEADPTTEHDIQSAPEIVKKNDEYDRWTEANCCSPNRTHTLSRQETSVWIGTVGFEADLTSLVALVLPAKYTLDGVTLKVGGSHEVTVEQGTTDAIQLPRCSKVDVRWGAAHQTTTRYFEGTKTCKYPKTVTVYTEPVPYTYVDWRLCGYFVDQCAECITELYSTNFLEYSIPVQPAATACGTASPNPCLDPLHPACPE